MLRPGRDYPQLRPGGVMSGAPPPMNAPMNAPLKVPMNTPVNNMAPHFAPPSMGAGSGYVSNVSGGRFAYPPPPPTPVPAPHLAPFLPSFPRLPFIPPLPHSPPVEAPPPPPPVPSPSAVLYDPLSTSEQMANAKLDSLQLPSQPSKPSDPEILNNIEGMAEFVMRNGPRYESMARAKHAGDPKYAFLFENDADVEAVVNRDLYQWKKEVFQQQAEAEAGSRLQKQSDKHSDSMWSQLGSQMVQQAKEIPVSPTMSDMDMEDDLAVPSLEGEEPVSPGRASHLNKMDRSQQKEADLQATFQSPLKPKGAPEEASKPLEKDESSSKGKRAQCRLTGDYTGSLINNYLSDGSEDSESSDPLATGVTGSGASDQLAKAYEVNPSAEEAGNMAVPTPLVSSFSNKVESVEIQQLTNNRPANTANGCGTTELDDVKAVGPQVGTAEMRLKSAQPVQESESYQGEILEKNTSPSTWQERIFQPSRRRSRSLSSGRSRSRSRSLTRNQSRSRSSSASQSLDDGSKSPSPTRSSLCNTSSRTSPKDKPNGLDKGEYKLQLREKLGLKGSGSNICLNFVRGRCFRGNMCRFQHQGPDKTVDEGDKAQELEEHGVLRVTASPPEGKSEVELVKNTGPGIEVAAFNKAKRKVGAESKEAFSGEEASKRSKSLVKTAVNTPSEGNSSHSADRDRSPRVRGGGPSPAQQDEADLQSAPAADPHVSRASHHSEVTFSSDLSPSNASRQSIGSSSQAAKAFGSLGQPYPGESGAFGFHQQYPSQLSGSAGFIPSKAYINTANEVDQGPFRTNFAVSNHVHVQPSSSGIGENTHFQPYSHGSSISGAPPSRSTLHEYSDLARSYASSQPSEYGLSFHAQSGVPLNARPPPLAFSSVTSTPSSTTVGQQTEHQGFTPTQHVFSSPFSMSAQQHQSLYPPYRGDGSGQFRLSDVAKHGVYPSQSQDMTRWSMPGSMGNQPSRGLEMPSGTGNLSYSYALTTIPPLPSIIELPKTTQVSTSSDQYDPLSDSFEPSVSGGPNLTSFSFLKMVEEGKSFGNSLASRLENLSPGLDLGKGDFESMNEAAGDPVVGIVENVSPPEDNRDWSPGQPAEAIEAKQSQGSSKAKKNNSRGLKLLRSAVAEYVKEVLKPTWKEGHMSKDAFKNIVKKAVDKVTATLPAHHIPKSQEKVDQFMSSSRTKISKLVQGYIEKYQKA